MLGQRWQDLDLDQNTMRIERQLLKEGREQPTFIPPKKGSVGIVKRSDHTIAVLQTHKRKQAEVKMANRTVYHDYGLVFA